MNHGQVYAIMGNDDQPYLTIITRLGVRALGSDGLVASTIYMIGPLSTMDTYSQPYLLVITFQ
jgi:hypothetical protein